MNIVSYDCVNNYMYILLHLFVLHGLYLILHLLFNWRAEKQPDTLLVDEVEQGERYELVITARCGLFRFRMGDMIQVVGFHEQCPIITIKER